MLIKSDQLCCYLEGVKVPIRSLYLNVEKNQFSSARVEISLAEPIVPKMWANALVQVTYIENKNGTRQEKLIHQGLCIGMDILEITGMISITTQSTFSSFNMNNTLDYMSPKRYGIGNITGDSDTATETDGSKIYIGNESVVNINPPSDLKKSLLSYRYFFIADQNQGINYNEFTEAEKFKIQLVVNKIPFAENYAFIFFENIAFDNFILTKSFVERFNLLSKVNSKSVRAKEKDEETSISIEISKQQIPIDLRRTGFLYLRARYKTKEVLYNNDGFSPVNTKYPYQAISERAKNDILSAKNLWGSQCSIDEILSDYNRYCASINVDPNLMIAQAKQESRFDPNIPSSAGALGWAQFIASTWPAYAPKGLEDPSNRTKVRPSIYAQIKYMDELIHGEKDDMISALRAYNGGPNWRAKNSTENANYATLILNIYKNYIQK